MSDEIVDFRQSFSMAEEYQRQQALPGQRFYPKTESKQNFSSLHQKDVSDSIQSPQENNNQSDSQAKKTHLIEQRDYCVKIQHQNDENWRNKGKSKLIKELQNTFIHFERSNDTSQRFKENIQKLAARFDVSKEYVLRQLRRFKEKIVSVDSQNFKKDPKMIVDATNQLMELFSKYQKTTKFFSRGEAIQYANLYSKYQFSKYQIQVCLKKYLKQNVESRLIKKEAKLTQNDFIFKIYQGYTNNNNVILFFSDFYYSTNQEECINVGLLCGEKGMVYQFIKQDKQEKRHILEVLLEKYWGKNIQKEKFVVIIGVNDIFKPNPRRNDNQHELFSTLQTYGASLFPLPRDQSNLNLTRKILQRIKFRHKKRDIGFFDLISSRLDKEQKLYNRNIFLEYTTREKSEN